MVIWWANLLFLPFVLTIFQQHLVEERLELLQSQLRKCSSIRNQLSVCFYDLKNLKDQNQLLKLDLVGKSLELRQKETQWNFRFNSKCPEKQCQTQPIPTPNEGEWKEKEIKWKQQEANWKKKQDEWKKSQNEWKKKQDNWKNEQDEWKAKGCARKQINIDYKKKYQRAQAEVEAYEAYLNEEKQQVTSR